VRRAEIRNGLIGVGIFLLFVGTIVYFVTSIPTSPRLKMYRKAQEFCEQVDGRDYEGCVDQQFNIMRRIRRNTGR
jgi:hypothetical protein